MDIVSIVQSFYELLGVSITATAGDAAGLGSLVFIVIASLWRGLTGAPEPTSQPTLEQKVEQKKQEFKKVVTTVETVEEVKVEEPKVETVSWDVRFNKGLSKTRGQFWSKLSNLLSGNKLSDELIEEVEEILYAADLGPKTTQAIMETLEENMGNSSFGLEDLKATIKSMIKTKMEPVQSKLDGDLFKFNKDNHSGTKVVMIVGVNGAGKTTTIGKLATKLKSEGANVVVGACDTFRAAAVDQLQVWCDRAGVEMIRAKENADPSGVGYEALQTAINKNADYCLLDTAGRLHTKSNLMEELSKSKRVLTKLDDKAPHEVILVIDAITGQNALRQAEEFNKSLGLTGLIFTKCDGSSKAGSAVTIVDQLQVPISYIGVGETVEDLNVFNLDLYLDALLDEGKSEAQLQ